MGSITDNDIVREKLSVQMHTVMTTWKRLQKLLQHESQITLDGKSLTIADVVAVASYNTPAKVSHDVNIRMKESVDLLKNHLDEGRHVYGVNTGYGESADTRTENILDLQKALTQHHQAAILLPSDRNLASNATLEDLKKHSLPNQIVRASMLIRCNSLLRGHSAVRIEVTDALITLLEMDLIPIIPLRGSISASGDLTPLAYIAGLLQGNRDIYVNGGRERQYRTMTAEEALGLARIQPITLGPKEGLGIMNGTGVSCAAATLAISQAQQLALISQVLTCMGTEALLGSSHNYHPFISETRPHPGQQEAAHNMFCWLKDSQLARDSHPKNIGLAQDRYALRTASQWIGPQLEDLLSAQRQVQIELNSTTDNPLIDVAGNAIHHGGNFQAASITSAMEKTLLSLQMLGKLIFAQSSEIINPSTNKGLPPNLSADDPSLSFTLKGADINMAAYMSELAYLAHPVSPHVQSAEMHNQAVNSLALVAARYTLDAVEVLSLMFATYIYVLCQALDLRSLHVEFTCQVEPVVHTITLDVFGSVIPEDEYDPFCRRVWGCLVEKWNQKARLDLSNRAVSTADDTIGVVLDYLTSHGSHEFFEESACKKSILSLRKQWKREVAAALVSSYDTVRHQFFEQPSTSRFLASKSNRIYSFVREVLNVPMHRGLEDDPTYDPKAGVVKMTIGSNISTIYAALRSGALMDVVANTVEDVL